MECGEAITSPARLQELGREGGKGEVAVVSPVLEGGEGEPRALFCAI